MPEFGEASDMHLSKVRKILCKFCNEITINARTLLVLIIWVESVDFVRCTSCILKGRLNFCLSLCEHSLHPRFPSLITML